MRTRIAILLRKLVKFEHRMTIARRRRALLRSDACAHPDNSPGVRGEAARGQPQLAEGASATWQSLKIKGADVFHGELPPDVLDQPFIRERPLHAHELRSYVHRASLRPSFRQTCSINFFFVADKSVHSQISYRCSTQWNLISTSGFRTDPTCAQPCSMPSSLARSATRSLLALPLRRQTLWCQCQSPRRRS